MNIQEYISKSKSFRRYKKAHEEAVKIITALESGNKTLDELIVLTGMERKQVSRRLNHLCNEGKISHKSFYCLEVPKEDKL